MARRKAKGRDIQGILLLDKPVGISSNGALQRVKRLYQAAKAGHTGSLDPLASGLLPICLGEATKFSSYLLNADKSYVTECKLGEVTTTGDAEGEVIKQRPVPAISEAQAKEVLESFLGDLEQLPPMFSAIKHQGQPLYKLAREGKEVERKPRQITIHELELLDMHGDRLRFRVRCSKGTYVRTLAEDIGEALGCGAHVTELRRVEVGDFSIDHASRLEQLEEILEGQGLAALDELLLATELALSQWPEVRLSEDSAYYLLKGQAVRVPQAPSEGLVRLYQQPDRFLGIGFINEDGLVAPKRLVKVA